MKNNVKYLIKNPPPLSAKTLNSKDFNEFPSIGGVERSAGVIENEQQTVIANEVKQSSRLKNSGQELQENIILNNNVKQLDCHVLTFSASNTNNVLPCKIESEKVRPRNDGKIKVKTGKTVGCRRFDAPKKMQKTACLLACAVLLTGLSGMALEVSDFGTSDHVIWERVTDTTGYTWSNSGALSDIKYNDNGSTTLYSASGILNAGNGDYYKFTYTNPYSNKASTGRIDSLNRNVEIEYFYKQISGDRGGAIYNNVFNKYSLNSDFIRNSTSISGGSIYNYNNGNIACISGNFINNQASMDGGAIIQYVNSNTSASISSISGNFIGNTAQFAGGAIYNGKSNNNFSVNIGTIKGNFIGNISNRGGGAIYNQGTIESIQGNFLYNIDKSAMNSGHSGGAIENSGIITTINGDFIGNKSGNGSGAILNLGTISRITGNFIGNSASFISGAINNIGTICIIADTQDILFYDNKAANSYVDLTLGERSILGFANLNAKINKNITFNGAIIGRTNIYSTININDSTKNATVGGTYNFNNTISNTTVNVASGAKINFGTQVQPDSTRSYGSMSNGTMTVNGSDVSLGTLNNRIDTSPTIANLTIKSPIKLAIDASLSNATADTVISNNITNQSGTNSGYLIIDAINLLTGTNESSVDILLTENSVLKAAYTLSNNILNNITLADGVDFTASSITYNNETGILTIAGGTSNSDNALMQVTLPDYLHIEQASIVPSATASIQNATTLSLDVSPSVTYNVYSNYSTKLYVTATAPTGETSSKALFGANTDDMTIVFTNSNGNASTTNIQNCLGASPDYNDNANAIAFKLNCATPVMTTGTTAASIAVNNNNVEYDVHSGMTTLGFSVAQSANAGTFFSNDPTGTYKATLMISNVAP